MQRTESSAKSAGFRYQAVQNLVLDMISGGTLNVGDRVPSLREMSSTVGVSVTTVMKAYAELERLGHLETRPQSGHYVSGHLQQPAPLPTVPEFSESPTKVDRFGLIHSVLRDMTTPGIVPFGAAVPAPELLPGKELAKLAKSVFGDVLSGSLGYGQLEGDRLLRQQISLQILDAGGGVPADELIITTGASEALSIALRSLTERGDVVAVESPCYFGYLLLCEAMGIKALEIPADPELGPNPEVLGDAIERHNVKAVILQPNIGNPLGAVFPDERKKAIYDVCSKSNLPIIEDDLYGDLIFGDNRPKSMLAWDDRGLVVHVSSFSKSLAMGYRVGWLRPGRYWDRMLKMKAASSLTGARPTQMVVARYLAEGRYKRHIRKLRSACKKQVATVSSHMQRHFPDETRISRPKGGMMLWIELPERVDALRLYERALAKKIGIAPGPLYSSESRFMHYMRINCGYPWNDRISEGLETLGTLVEEMA